MDNAVSLRMMCKEHCKKRGKKFQKKINNGYICVGDIIEKEFTQADKSEFMWIRIYEIRENYIIGAIANEPRYLTNINYKDVVRVMFYEVEDYLKI